MGPGQHVVVTGLVRHLGKGVWREQNPRGARSVKIEPAYEALHLTLCCSLCLFSLQLGP